MSFISSQSEQWPQLLSRYCESRPSPAAQFWGAEQIVNAHQHHKIGGLMVAGELTAFVIYQVCQGILEVLYLETAPAFRGQGLMKRCLKALMCEEGCEELWLEVHESNWQAIKFYEDFGFSLQGTRPRYYRDGGAALVLSYLK